MSKDSYLLALALLSFLLPGIPARGQVGPTNCSATIPESTELQLQDLIANTSRSLLVNPDHRVLNEIDHRFKEWDREYRSKPELKAALRGRFLSTMAADLLPYFSNLALRYRASGKLEEADLDRLSILGIAHEEKEVYVKNLAQELTPAFEVLENVGALKDGSLTLESLKIDGSSLFSKDKVYTSLMTLMGPAALEFSLGDRGHAVIFGDQVYFGSNDGSIRKQNLEEYTESLNAEILQYQEILKGHQALAREGSAFTTLMSGDDSSSRALEALHKKLVETQKSIIKKYRVSPELKAFFIESERRILREEAIKIEGGIAKIRAAKMGVVAAFAIPVAIYAAPFAAASVGIAGATATKTSATLAMVGLSVPVILAAGQSALDARRHPQTNFWCRFQESIGDAAPSALLSGALLAALPSAAHVLGTATAKVFSAKATSAAVITARAQSVSGLLNLGAAGYFMFGMGIGAIKKYEVCREKLLQSRMLSSTGFFEEAEIYENEAAKHCLESGVDLAFALVMGRQFSKITERLQVQRKSESESKLESPLNPRAQGEFDRAYDLLVSRELSYKKYTALSRASRVGTENGAAGAVRPVELPHSFKEILAKEKILYREGGFTQGEIKLLRRKDVWGPKESFGFKERVQDNLIEIRRGGSRFLLYPLTALPRTINLAAEYRGRPLSFGFRMATENGLNFTGHILFTTVVGQSIPGAIFMFYPETVSITDYMEESTMTDINSTAKTVYVDGITTGEPLDDFARYDFELRHKFNPNAHYLKVSGIDDMWEKLEELSLFGEAPIERVIIMGHGLPGRMKIGGEDFDSDRITQLKSSNALAKDAEVLLNSCLVGGETWLSDPGADFQKNLAAKLLPGGGSIQSATVSIVVVPFERGFDWKPLDPTWTKAVMAPLQVYLGSYLIALGQVQSTVIDLNRTSPTGRRVMNFGENGKLLSDEIIEMRPAFR